MAREAVQGALARLTLGNLAREKTFRGLCGRWGMSSDLEERLARLDLSLRFIDTCMIFTCYFKDLLKTSEGAS